MKAQSQQTPFEIVRNARNSRASRLRKSSISAIEKEKTITKSKKLRKMTMNADPLPEGQPSQLDELLEKTAARSGEEQGAEDIEESPYLCHNLELGHSHTQSMHTAELEIGIRHGIGSERQLDLDFSYSWKRYQIEWAMLE